MKLTSFSDIFDTRSSNDFSSKGKRASPGQDANKPKFVSVSKRLSLPPDEIMQKLKEEAVQLAKNVKVKGTGLSRGLTAISNRFKLKVENMNLKYLNVDVEGPSTVTLNKISTPNNVCKYAEFDYKVNLPGEYMFYVGYRQEPIPGSPFRVKIAENKKFVRNSAQVVKVSGRGLRHARAGMMSMFRVNLNRTGNKHGRLSVYLDNEEGVSYGVDYIYWGGGCTVVYNCPHEGRYEVRIKYNGKHIPGSPFPLECAPNPGQWLSTAFKRLTHGSEKDLSTY